MQGSSSNTALVLLVCAGLQPATGYAQGSGGGKSIALEEVIVTANRREENLQEVPMSVSAFTGDFFKETGASDLQTLQNYTPSLKILNNNDSRSTSIRIRGIGSVGTNSGIDPSVGVFIDGVYQGRAGMTISDLIDIERVEVLRGPQGTLYGKNTSAGAISIFTKQPGPEFAAEAELTFDNDERVQLRGMVNIPLGNGNHAARVTGFGNYGDHIYENTFEGARSGEDLNDTNRWGTKGRLMFDFEESGTFLLTLDYSKDDTDCCAMGVIDYEGLSTLNSPLTNTPSAARQQEYGLADPPDLPDNPSPNYPGYRLDYSAFETTQGFSPPQADPFDDKYWFDGPLKNEVSVGGVALEWNREIAGEHDLTFINAWRHYESDSTFDGDFSAYDAVGGLTEVDLDQYSSELRIASIASETFEYQGGLYYYYSEFDSLGQFEMAVPLIEALGLELFFPGGSLNTDDNTYTTTSYAAFGQLVWNFAERWSATLGLRWTREVKERDGSQLTDGVNPIFGGGENGSPLDIPPVAGPNVFYDDERDDSDVSPTLNLRYFATDDLMLYTSVSRGFKSGGFDQRRVPAGENGEFEDETSTSYEFGWKGTWLERRLQVNGTLFYVDYDDFQSQTFDGNSIKVTNAGVMESYGLELDAIFAAAANLTLGTALGYTNATYDEFERGQCTVEQTFEKYYVEENAQFGTPGAAGSPPPQAAPGTTLCLQDLAGEDVDNSPEWTVSTFAQYETELTDNLLAIVRAEHNYIDSFFLDQDLDPNLKNDAVHLVNLRLTLTNLDNDWEAALWGRNLLNEEYYAFGIDIPTVGGYGGVVAPDMAYGVTLRYNWR